MTSIILMQKQLNMKLDNTERDRIKLEQKNINHKKYEAIRKPWACLNQKTRPKLDRVLNTFGPSNKNTSVLYSSLRGILENQTTNETCRLCLRSGGKRIFGGTQDFDVALNIKHIFGIEYITTEAGTKWGCRPKTYRRPSEARPDRSEAGNPIFPAEITEYDNKPQHICGECEHTVRQAARLKQTAEATQWRLQEELEMVAESASDWSEGPERHGGYLKADDAEVARAWACGKCRASFSTQEEFTAHEQLPSCRTQLSYVCETCGMELKSMSRLKRHRLTHTGSLPHLCAACPYRARTAHALAVHARAHSGARPARCALCPAAFASASNLASHRRRHLPPRHHCDLCRKGFKFKVALQNHMASQHSNAKPYHCNICPKTFSTRKMILRHELKAHNRPKMRSGVLPTYMRLREDS